MKLLKHLRAAAKLVEKKPTLFVLGRALIQNGICTVGSLTAQYSFPIKITGEGTIDWKELKGILVSGGFAHGAIEDNTCTLNLDGTDIKLQVEPAEEYPVIRADYGLMPQEFTLPSQMFLDALPFAADDTLRLNMNGVAITRNHLVASEGHTLFYRKVSLPDVNVIFSPKAISTFQPCGEVTFVVSTDKIHTRMEFEDATIVSMNIQDQYPDFLAVIPEFKYETELNRKMVDIAIERLKTITPDMTNEFTLEIDGISGEAQLAAKDEMTNREGTVNIGKVSETRALKVVFNLGYFALALSTNSDICKLEWVHQDKMFRVNGNGLMPILQNVD